MGIEGKMLGLLLGIGHWGTGEMCRTFLKLPAAKKSLGVLE
jgi:hypothetical protein